MMLSVKIAKISEPVQEDKDVVVDVETFRDIDGVYILARDVDRFKNNPRNVDYRLISVGRNHAYFIHYQENNGEAEIRLPPCDSFDIDMFYNTGEQVYFNVGE